MRLWRLSYLTRSAIQKNLKQNLSPESRKVTNSESKRKREEAAPKTTEATDTPKPVQKKVRKAQQFNYLRKEVDPDVVSETFKWYEGDFPKTGTFSSG